MNRARSNFGTGFFLCGAGAALMFLNGCSSFRTEMGQPLQVKANDFTDGKTRLETVLNKLGPPNGATRLPQGLHCFMSIRS